MYHNLLKSLHRLTITLGANLKEGYRLDEALTYLSSMVKKHLPEIAIVVSCGAGSETRLVIGIVILSGVFAATIFTLFIVPGAYNLFAHHTKSPGVMADKLVKEEAEQEKREIVKL